MDYRAGYGVEGRRSAASQIGMMSVSQKRFSQMFAVTLLITIFSGAYSDGADLALKLRCACGCKEGMLVCSHKECTVAPKMRAEYKELLAAGASQDAILQRLGSEYGDAALPEGSASAATPIALFVPFAVLLLAIPTIIIVLRLWKAGLGSGERTPTHG